METTTKHTPKPSCLGKDCPECFPETSRKASDMGKELANIATRIAEDGCLCTDDVLCREHIVLNHARRAVNRDHVFEELLAALRRARFALKTCQEKMDPDGNGMWKCLDDIEQAIAKVEGRA